MTMIVDRKESMSPNGKLQLFIQDDGDVIINVQEGSPTGELESFASIEFCAPFTGGGGSKHTWEALRQLALAMAKDNADEQQKARRGEFPGTEILTAIQPTRKAKATP